MGNFLVMLSNTNWGLALALTVKLEVIHALNEFVNLVGNLFQLLIIIINVILSSHLVSVLLDLQYIGKNCIQNTSLLITKHLNNFEVVKNTVLDKIRNRILCEPTASRANPEYAIVSE